MPRKKYIMGCVHLTLSMVFLGATVVIGKILIAEFPVFLLLGIRFLIGTLCYAIPYFFEKSLFYHSITLTRTEGKLLFSQAFFGAFLFNLLTLEGLKFTSPNIASILTSLIPAFITVFSFFILKEKISKFKAISLVFAMSGLILVTTDAANLSINHLSMVGNFLIIAGIISGALFPVLVKLLSNKVSVFLISFNFNLFGLLLFSPLALKEVYAFRFELIHLNDWILVLAYGFTANVLYLHCWNKGLAVIEAGTASLFIPIMPVSTMGLAYIFLNEKITLPQSLGVLLVMSAIIAGVLKKNE